MGKATIPLVGAGIGAASSLLGPKERQTTQTSQIDPQTQAFLDQFRQQALQQAQGGPNQFLQQAGQGFGGLTDNLGFAQQQGLEGIEQFFNPFQQEVIGGVQGDFDRQRQQAEVSARQQATQSGAFGGSREAVLNAELQGGVNRNEASTLANLRQGGFNQAAQNLFGQRRFAGNLGLAGLQGLAGVGGQQGQQQFQNLLGLRGAIGPFGQTSTQTEPFFNNPFAGALGGAATAGGLFGMFGGGGGGGNNQALLQQLFASQGRGTGTRLGQGPP